MAFKILCFGDSNTWGYVPGTWDADTGSCEQYETKNRWPYALKAALSERDVPCSITEDGVPGRTTNIEHKDAPELHGIRAFTSAYIETASVFDIIIIVLGVNDLKYGYKKTADSIADDLCKLGALAKKASPKSEIIITLPPKISKEDGFGIDFKGAKDKSTELKECLIKMSEEAPFHLLQMEYELNKIDGVHFSLSDNENLAKNLNHLICSLKLSKKKVLLKSKLFTTEQKTL
jgi:lysophospholipase L1-like esterase